MNKKGFIGVIIIVIIIVGAGVFLLIHNGIIKNPFDPCESKFSSCNHGCGEGILSSICKEKCSYDYRICKEG